VRERKLLWVLGAVVMCDIAWGIGSHGQQSVDCWNMLLCFVCSCKYQEGVEVKMREATGCSLSSSSKGLSLWIGEVCKPFGWRGVAVIDGNCHGFVIVIRVKSVMSFTSLINISYMLLGESVRKDRENDIVCVRYGTYIYTSKNSTQKCSAKYLFWTRKWLVTLQLIVYTLFYCCQLLSK